MKIPARYSNLLFGGMLSIIMVTIISGTVVRINQSFLSNAISILPHPWKTICREKIKETFVCES